MIDSMEHAPAAGITIRSYNELSRIACDFATGYYGLLVLVGPPGVAKSQTVRRAMGNRKHLYVDNHMTAFSLYRELYRYQDSPVVVDDVDHIYADKSIVRLLKALCNTDDVKYLTWLTTHRLIGHKRGQTPPQFETASRVCLIANEWKSPNANVKALEDRALFVTFEPTVDEVHTKVDEWFDDDVVYDFIGRHRAFIKQPTMRYYVHGKEMRRADPSTWRGRLLELMGVDDKTRAVVSLVADPNYDTERAREAAFEQRGFGERATYYRIKSRLPDVPATTTASAS